jgi:hypothetical protein
MGKLRITADKVLRFGIATVDESQLRGDVALIEVRRAEMGVIVREIRDALPSLHEMSHQELQPIYENRGGQ